jgi:hypothetical protein
MLQRSPDSRQRPFGPSQVHGLVCGKLYRHRPVGGPAMRAGFPLPFVAAAVRFSSHPVPARISPTSRTAYRGPVGSPGPDGVPVFRTHEMRPVRVPPLPRGRGVHADGLTRPGRHRFFPEADPGPRTYTPSPGLGFTRFPSGVHSHSPFRPSPLLVLLRWMGTGPRDFPRASPRSGRWSAHALCAGVGTDLGHWSGEGHRFISTSFCPSHSYIATSRRTVMSQCSRETSIP